MSKKQKVFDIEEVIAKIAGAQSETELKTVVQQQQQWLEWLLHNKHISSQAYDNAKDSISYAKDRKAQDIEENALPEKDGATNNSVRGAYYISLASFFTVLIMAGITGIVLYQTRVAESQIERVDSSNEYVLPFKGVLKDIDGSAVQTKRDVRFNLYEEEDSSSPIYSGSCIGEDGITPNYTGEFTVVLGSDCGMSPIPENVYNQGQLYLGLQIGDSAEIDPRSLIYTLHSGQHLSTGAGNTLGADSISSYVNNNNLITINEDSPTLSSTLGTFTIEGQQINIRTTSKEQGTIMFQPTAGAATVFAAGNVGIGTFAPQTPLSVIGTEPAYSVATFHNLTSNDDNTTSILDLGLGTSQDGDSAQFIQFYAGTTQEDKGTKVGAIRLNNEGVVYETSNADFAEYFYTADKKGLIPGAIVTLSDKGIKASEQGENIIGVVSDSAGFIGNKKRYGEDKSVLVGLVGQVETLVSTLNGPISPGDAVGISFIPGYGMKSSRASNQIVGYALKAMDETVESSFSNSNCPTQYQKTRDLQGRLIECGKLLIIIR